MSEQLLRQIIRQELATIIREFDVDASNPPEGVQQAIDRSASVIWNAIRSEYGPGQSFLEE